MRIVWDEDSVEKAICFTKSRSRSEDEEQRIKEVGQYPAKVGGGYPRCRECWWAQFKPYRVATGPDNSYLKV
jgi:hypothetical protein